MLQVVRSRPRAPSTPAPVEVVAAKRYVLSHLSDDVLLRGLAAAVARERTATAEVLAHIAEADARKLYLPTGYSSMFAYCVGELHLSEQAALKRIQAARAARRLPDIFEAVADGRLHLSGVVLLAPYLAEGTAGGLLAAATHRTKLEIEQLLAERFPKSDVLAWMEPTLPSQAPSGRRTAGPGACQLSPGIVGTPATPGCEVGGPGAKPLSSESFAVQFTMSARAHDDLRYAQALLGHRVPTGDIAGVVERALAVYVAHLEKRKFAATTKPRSGHGRTGTDRRHLPARVRRAVWERDGGRCTFVSGAGHRCEARGGLEFDHALEVARGGEATVEGIRLRCRAHNQYTAELTFGAEFMRHKRIAAAEARAAAKSRRAGGQPSGGAHIGARAPEKADELDVVPWLRALGFSGPDAHRAAARCEGILDASLEERVRAALSCFRVRGIRARQAPQPTGTLAPRA